MNPKKSRNNCKNCSIECNKHAQIYCSVLCQKEWEYKEIIRRWKIGEWKCSNVVRLVSNHIRRYLFEKFSSKCQKCSWNKINPITKKVPLEINHINGKSWESYEENLELLCPNCHSLTPTHGALNTGNGRRRNKRHPQYKQHHGAVGSAPL